MDEQRFRAAEATFWQSLGVAPRERWLELRHSGTWVRVQEVGEGPPALFVHGSSVAGTSFAELAAALPEVRCLVLDRPGCGLSEPLPKPLGIEGLPAHADALVVDVLDALELERAHVVSTSMGGYYALRAAAAHPERIDRIVHLGWCLGSEPAFVPLLMKLAGLPGVGTLMARLPVTAGAVRAMLRRVGLAKALDAGALSEEGIRWNVTLNNHTNTRVHEYRLAQGAPLDELIRSLVLPPEVLAQVRSPTLVVFGTGDPFGTIETMTALADALPDGRIRLIEGGSHAVWLDHPRAAIELVRPFLVDDTIDLTDHRHVERTPEPPRAGAS